MADLYFNVDYPGVRTFTRNATIPLSRGVRPSVFTIQLASVDIVPTIGTLRLTRNGSTIAEFRRCAVDGGVFATGDGRTFSLKLLDRRQWWHMGGGVVNGHWNIHRPDGSIIEETRKDPRELVRFLLSELGERNPDVNQVPRDVVDPPELRWDATPTVAALDGLLRQIGCDVVLDTSDRIRVVRVGLGRDLPTRNLRVDNVSLESLAVPDDLQFIGGHQIVQSLLLLRPVGKDLDGKWKPIDELSYRPKDGWESDSPEYLTSVDYGKDDDEKRKARALALETVWRCYQVDALAHRSLKIPGLDADVDDGAQIMLRPALTDKIDRDDGEVQYEEPYVVGQWFDSTLRVANTEPGSRFEGSFTIDQLERIVTFDRPMYRIYNDEYKPASLYLMAAFNVKGAKTRVPLRFTKTLRLKRKNRSGGGPMPVIHDDVERIIKLEHRLHESSQGVFRYQLANTEINDSEVEDAANYYLAQKLRELEPKVGSDRPYVGWQRIDPDGAIAQVTWSMRDGEATMRASRNMEHNHLVPSHAQRRRAMQLDAREHDDTAKAAGKYSSKTPPAGKMNG
jgi:hypothetical protein